MGLRFAKFISVDYFISVEMVENEQVGQTDMLLHLLLVCPFQALEAC